VLNHFFSSRFAGVTASLLLATSVALLAGCGGGGGSAPSTTTTGSGTGTGTTVTAVVSSLSLGTSAISIKTDNSTSATLTATPIDASNAAMSGVPVTFATTSGVLSASTQTSGANGIASVTLLSGSIDSSNRTATVTVTAGGKTASIPVLITGSTLTLTPSAGSVQVGAGTITLVAAAKDAGGAGKNNQTVRFSIAAASTGAATLSASSKTTGVDGSTSAVTLTPSSAGSVVVTGEWLDSSSAVSVSATQTITVTPAAGIPFAITAPTANPLSLSTGATQSLAVSVPATINGSAVASVRISSTAGTWAGLAPAAGPSASIIQTPAANAVAATFTAPNTSGAVTVQADAVDASNVLLSSLTRTFAISAPAASAASLSLQTSVAVVVPSSGSNSSTATLTATVRDAATNSVGSAPVLFELLGTTGSGESISPALAYTDSTGKATATFSAGSSSTSGAVYARARVVGQTCNGLPQSTPVVIETNPLCNSTALTVASAAVSVTIGLGTTVADTATATQYILAGSVLVVNANGSPVANSTVTLSVFPAQYRNGSITGGPGGCIAPATSFVDSEDANRNGILDPGEDTPVAQTAAQIAASAISQNAVLSPPQAAGGSIPATVTTDSNGAATFSLQYPKASALFIADEIAARVVVSGTERSAKTTFVLPMSTTDAASPCPLARTATY